MQLKNAYPSRVEVWFVDSCGISPISVCLRLPGAASCRCRKVNEAFLIEGSSFTLADVADACCLHRLCSQRFLVLVESYPDTGVTTERGFPLFPSGLIKARANELGLSKIDHKQGKLNKASLTVPIVPYRNSGSRLARRA